MHNLRIIVAIVLALLLTLIGCSSDAPTKPKPDEQQFYADSSEHLVTDILTFHGGSEFDWGTSVIELPDRGLAIAGSTDSWGSGKNSLYLIRTDSTGRVLWDKIFGGGGDDNAERMALTSDNNLVIAGVTSSFTGSYDFYLLKVSLAGDLIWQNSLGTPIFEWGTDLAVLPDGYAVCGYTIPPGSGGGDFMLVRTDLSGNQLWSKTYDRPDRTWPYAMTSTDDGGLLMAGLVYYESISDIDVYLMKVDDTGGVVWEDNYGGAGDDKGLAVVASSDGGYAVAGSSRSFSASNYEMVYVLKVDDGGSVEWEESFGEGGNLKAFDIVENPDGSLILTGITTLDGTGTGIAKLDGSGNLLWNESIGLAGSGSSLYRDSRGRYSVTGFAWDAVVPNTPDVLLMRVEER